MSDDKKRPPAKDGPKKTGASSPPPARANGGAAATKGAGPGLRTLVGVPTLAKGQDVPIEEPSETLVGHRPEELTGEPNTAVDVKAMSHAEAERVLSWTGFTQEEIPTAKGPESGDKRKPVAPQSLPTQVGTPAIGGPLANASTTLKGVAPQSPSRPPTMATMKGTPRASPAPAAHTTTKGRATLLLDGSSPPIEPSGTGEHAAIVVPPAAAMTPKAVTQPPPWGDGAVHVARDIPRAARPGVGPMRPREPSAEELSGSILLPAEDESKPNDVEELSGSILVPDEPAAPRPGKKTQPGYAVPRAHHGPTKQSPQMPSTPPPPPVRTKSSAPPPPPVARGASAAPPKAAATPRPNTAMSAAAPHATAPHQMTTAPGIAPVGFPPPALTPPAPPAASPVPHATSTAPGLAPAIAPPPPPTVPDAAVDPSLPAGVPVPTPIELPPPPNWPPPSTSTRPPSPDAPVAAAPAGGAAAPLDATRPLTNEPPEQNLLPQRFRLLANRPKWVLPAIAAAGFLVGVGLIGLVIGAVRGGDSSPASSATAKGAASAHARPAATTSTAAATTSAATTPSPPATTAPAPQPAASTSTTACTLAGDAHTIAANAVIGAGVEATTLDGGDLALGFAPSATAALAVRLDPTSFAAKASARGRSLDPIRRVTPFLNGRHAFDALVDSDHRGDRVLGRRAVLGDGGPFDLGASGGQVVAVPHGGTAGAKLWPLEGDGGPPEQIRAVRVPGASEATYAIAFRRAGAIWIGLAAGAKPAELAAKGALTRVAGLGGDRLGSPTIAASGTSVFVAWADHDAAGAPYAIRYVSFDAASAPPADASTFALPPGGEGTGAMSPGAAGLAGDRFLLVWTEGPEGRHQVRAQTLSSDARTLGAPMTLSKSGVNAGQGQAAATPDGRAVGAFLQENGKLFEIIAAPLACPM